jgi:hypothetical protein
MKKIPISPKITLDAALDFTLKSFSDQKKSIGIEADAVSSDKRSDTTVLVNLFPSMAIVPAGPATFITGLGITYVSNASNQGYADSESGKFTSDYYNYSKMSVSPVFKFSFNTIPLNLGIIYEYTQKNYTGRLAKDSEGNLLDEKQSETISYVSIDLAYPILENLSVKLSPRFMTSSSNMKYESYYKYNYSANSVFLGVNYSYE